MSHIPEATFEVLFEGEGIYPEKIPLGTLARCLTAIQRLATGKEELFDDEEEAPAEKEALRLVNVKRGSALYSIFGPSPESLLEHLRIVGRILEAPESIGQNDYVINPIDRLSAGARALGCAIVIRTPNSHDGVLARIEPASFERIERTLFVDGETSITGDVKRVGGVTAIRCALRVPFQERLLFCKVNGAEVARKLGDSLYKRVVAQGKARWLKGSWKIFQFEISDVQPMQPGSLRDAVEALRAAGGKCWDDVDDPEAFLEEVTGR